VSPITHFLASWTIAEIYARDRRERAWITAAGVVPDLDGLGVVVDFANRLLARPDSEWFGRLHHVLFHGAFGAIAFLLVAATLGFRRWRLLAMMMVTFHFHLICDVLGSRGPAGEIWPIDYLSPLSHSWLITWVHQWPLNAWPNIAFTFLLIIWAIIRAVQVGISPVSIFSPRIDSRVVAALRQRWYRGREA